MEIKIINFKSEPRNNPFAPEWNEHLSFHLNWWQRIIHYHIEKESITITPEFGPFPYMPQSPFDQKPLANQQELNKTMKKTLEKYLKY